MLETRAKVEVAVAEMLERFQQARRQQSESV